MAFCEVSANKANSNCYELISKINRTLPNQKVPYTIQPPNYRWLQYYFLNAKHKIVVLLVISLFGVIYNKHMKADSSGT